MLTVIEICGGVLLGVAIGGVMAVRLFNRAIADTVGRRG